MSSTNSVDYTPTPHQAALSFNFNNSTVFCTLFLSYITLLNVNFFFNNTKEDISYIPIAILISSFSILIFIDKKLSVKTNVTLSIFLTVSIFIPALISYIKSTNILYHWFYFAMLWMQMMFVLHLAVTDIKLPSASYLRRALRVAITVTLLASLAHYSVGDGRPGWIWPINISIQELCLIVLLSALICLSSPIRELPIILLFVPLLFFRSSGKTALFIIISIPFLIYSFQISRIVRFFIRNFVHLYFVIFFITIIYALIFHSNDILYYFENMKSIIIDQRVSFWKRKTLILEGMTFLTSIGNLLTGSGFGSMNYLFYQESHLENTPQLFILTLFVYGGMPLFLSFYIISELFRRKLVDISESLYGEATVNTTVISILLFLTTHEYFNNPYFYGALSVFVLSLRARAAEDRLFKEKSRRSSDASPPLPS